jgi:hypothetical protein
VRIELESLPPYLRSPHPVSCGICGIRFPLGAAIARAECDDGVDWREVCPKCLASGSDGIVATLRRRAAIYRQIAEDFEEVADEGIRDMPTPEELRLMQLLA